MGNEIYRIGELEIGNFVLTINTFDFGELEVRADHMAMTISLTPEDALNGFMLERKIVDDKYVHVNRTGKLTLPGTSVRLAGLGPPNIKAPSSRNDLIITFQLTNREEDDKIENDAYSDADGVGGGDEDWQGDTERLGGEFLVSPNGETASSGPKLISRDEQVRGWSTHKKQRRAMARKIISFLEKTNKTASERPQN